MVEIKEVKRYSVCGIDFKTIDQAERHIYNKCIDEFYNCCYDRVDNMSLAKDAIQILIDNKIFTKDKLIKFKNDML